MIKLIGNVVEQYFMHHVIKSLNLSENRNLAKASRSSLNKLAKARKTRKSPGMLGLKNFGLGKLLAQFFL